MATGLVFISAVISYSLAYDAIDAINDDSFATALTAHKITVLLIGMVRKQSIGPIILSKQKGTLGKAQTTV